jgi:hypothetical protein
MVGQESPIPLTVHFGIQQLEYTYQEDPNLHHSMHKKETQPIEKSEQYREEDLYISVFGQVKVISLVPLLQNQKNVYNLVETKLNY